MNIDYETLSREEKLILLKDELKKISHEINISKLVYSLHDCDSYEDIFRDNVPLLEDKKKGIVIAIKNLENYYE